MTRPPTNTPPDMQHDRPPVILEREEGGVAVVTLNRPKALNALSEIMLDGLQHIWDELRDDANVQVVILRGEGGRFCAGHDLKEMTQHRSDEDNGHHYFKTLFAQCSKMMLTMQQLPQPIIAEVAGIATAAGCQLVANCDLAYAEQNARFATSGVNIGLFCSTPMVALSRAVARKHAMEMLLLGNFVSAEQAAKLGLINDVFAPDELSINVRQKAEIIAAKSPVAIKIGKNAFYRQIDMEITDAYAYTGRVMADNMMTHDTKSGIKAFIEKKNMPKWTGK